MSTQFGRWNLDGRPVEAEYLERVQSLIAPYGPDKTSSIVRENVCLSYGAFHTTSESRRETQPHSAPSGALLTWDGRLDNRSSLIDALEGAVDVGSTDVEIVAAAWSRWEERCFAKLIGDWAFAAWEPSARRLTLAKDVIGTRHLYYARTERDIVWSTLLDPLVLLQNDVLQLDEEYIAGWFSLFPAAHLTPYVGIHAVPPASFVVIEPGRTRITKYWDFDPGKRIRYRTDEEYEEHFRMLLGQAVERRLRADAPLVAELSGGMDSSSIVCMADRIVASGAPVQPRIETMSIYNDLEPNWDERPYFMKVEAQRGRTGYHIDASASDLFQFDAETFAAMPGAGEPNKACAEWMKQQRMRVVLSGIGGDEVCGGVPTPIPELADLLASAQWKHLLRQLRSWALDKRVPWFHLLAITLKGFLPLSLRGVPDYAKPLAWLDHGFVRRHESALQGHPQRRKLFGPLPSFQTNLHALETLRRQIACTHLQKGWLTEYRYPYLDRDLLEFSFAIPRAQLVRPGQRRSLMRRALASIVPSELLNRKRKAYAGRSVLIQFSQNWPQLMEITNSMASESAGLADSDKFAHALNDALTGKDAHIVGMMRTLSLEIWLRSSGVRYVLGDRQGTMQTLIGKNLSSLQRGRTDRLQIGVQP